MPPLPSGAVPMLPAALNAAVKMPSMIDREQEGEEHGVR